MATSRPNSDWLRPSCSRMDRPMIEKIIQTAKQVVKAMVLSQSARWRSAWLAGWVEVMGPPGWRLAGRRSGLLPGRGAPGGASRVDLAQFSCVDRRK